MTDTYLTPLYSRKEFQQVSSHTRIPESSMEPESAYQLIQEELHFDGSPSLNLATFVNTWMDEWGTRIGVEHLDKNFINHEEYPQSNMIEKRIIWMMGNWYGVEFTAKDADPNHARGYYGSTTIGSSEAIMLSLIAHKKNWSKQIRLNPQSSRYDRCFVVITTHMHTCWDKFGRYFDAGVLYIPLDDDKFIMTEDDVYEVLSSTIEDSPYRDQIVEFCEYPEEYLENLQNRTVGELVMAVGCATATTFTGNSDDVKGASDAIDRYCEEQKELQLDIPIHVDAGSGGFTLPFTNNGGPNDVKFNFRDVPRARSINISNHKFGLVYPGLGTVIFRNSQVVDQSLIYRITYLGGNFYDYTVNFSRGTYAILMQYYNFLRLGLEGYRSVICSSVARARKFVSDLEKSQILDQWFENISDLDHYPIIVLKWRHGERGWTMKELSDGLRTFGWTIPTYQLPTHDHEEPDGMDVLRIVVRQNITGDKLYQLVQNMEQVVDRFQSGRKRRSMFDAGRL